MSRYRIKRENSTNASAYFPTSNRGAINRLQFIANSSDASPALQLEALRLMCRYLKESKDVNAYKNALDALQAKLVAVGSAESVVASEAWMEAVRTELKTRKEGLDREHASAKQSANEDSIKLSLLSLAQYYEDIADLNRASEVLNTAEQLAGDYRQI